MRKILLFLAMLFVSASAVKSQQLYFNAGKTISGFEYKNSLGESVSNILFSNNTSMGLGIRTNKYLPKDLFANFGASFNNYGAIGSDAAVDNFFEWKTSYLGANLGFDYNLYKIGKFSAYAKASVSTEFLIQGTQTLNNQIYNLVGAEDFNAPILFYRGGLGMYYEIYDRLTIFSEYSYGQSLSFKKSDAKLKNKAHNISFGLFVDISRRKPVETAVLPSFGLDITHLEKQLTETNHRISVLEKKSKDYNELQKKLASDRDEAEKTKNAKEKELKVLKEDLSLKMVEFADKDIDVNLRDGKVYVLMSNQFMFETASWEISPLGIKTIEALSDYLADKPDISVRIEGHTDNTPPLKTDLFKDNWELSLKRANAVVEILKKNTNINPANITVVGRGELDPVTSNETSEGRAKNRRIEFVLSTK